MQRKNFLTRSHTLLVSYVIHIWIQPQYFCDDTAKLLGHEEISQIRNTYRFIGWGEYSVFVLQSSRLNNMRCSFANLYQILCRCLVARNCATFDNPGQKFHSYWMHWLLSGEFLYHTLLWLFHRFLTYPLFYLFILYFYLYLG